MKAYATIILLMMTVVNAIIVPFSNTVTNVCNGEVVIIEGRLNIVAKDQVFHINTVGVKGTGTLGNDYIVSQVVQFPIDDSPGATTVTSQLTLNVVSKGNAPNFMVHNLIHVTTTPDGDITAEVTHLDSECSSSHV